MISLGRCVSLLVIIIICILTFINNALAINYGGPPDVESKLNDSEQLILKKVSNGENADLATKSGEKPEITSRFLEVLLTGEFNKLKIHRHGVNIQNAKIVIPPDNKLDLKLAKVPFEVNFSDCDFTGDVDFEDSEFDNNLSMKYCNFSGQAHFIKMVVKKSAYFRNSVFLKKADFSSVKVGLSFNMESTMFCSSVYFTNITIKENAYFGEHTIFVGPLDFSRANVGGELDFGSESEGSLMIEGLDLTDAKVGTYLALRGALVFGRAKFDRADIKGDLKFEKSKFLDPDRYASFPGAKIGHIANFEDAVFRGPVDFDGLEVGLELKAKNARFEGIDSKYNIGVTAGGLKVGTRAFFVDADFQGPINFSGADIGGVFDATGAKFNSTSIAEFSGMKVGQLAQFTNAEFHGPVNFSGSKVGGILTATTVPSEKVSEETTGTKFKGIVFGDKDNLGEISFIDAHLTDLELQGTPDTPLRISKLYLTRLHVDKDLTVDYASVGDLEAGTLQVDGQAAFKHIEVTQKVDFRYSRFGILELAWKRGDGPPKEADLIQLNRGTGTEDKIVFDGMIYKGLRPLDEKNRISWIKLINYGRLDTGNYKQMENYFLDLGYESEANQVFMEMKRRELEESWAPKRWATKVFWGLLAGYGRKPYYALIASLFVILLGAFFYSPILLKEEIYEKWKGWFETDKRYKSWIFRLVFSLDQFLPAVNLGLAGELDLKKVTFGKLIYFNIHKILGWILILIGLAAITTQLK